MADNTKTIEGQQEGQPTPTTTTTTTLPNMQEAAAPPALERQTSGEQKSRNLTRKTLQSLGESASSLASNMKASSAIFRMGFAAMDKVLSPATSALKSLQPMGDQMLTRLDARLDSTIDAIQQAAPPQQERHFFAQPRMLNAHWESLKSRFTETQWFGKVNEILLQNQMVQRVTSEVTEQVVTPAEQFFSTAIQTFMENDSDFDTFLAHMKRKMGPTWDDRLTAPARAFFATAQTSKALVGAGRFFEGAYLLGKQRVNTVIDDLIARWNQVLTTADSAVDHYLPDTAEVADDIRLDEDMLDDEDEDEDEDLEDYDDEDFDAEDEFYDPMDLDADATEDQLRRGDASSGTITPNDAHSVTMTSSSAAFGAQSPYTRGMRMGTGMGYDVAALTPPLALRAEIGGTDVSEDEDAPTEDVKVYTARMVDAEEGGTFDSDRDSQSSAGKKRGRSVGSVVNKVAKRVRQRIPLVRELPTQVKTKLQDSSWFSHVDSILSQNSMIQLMQAQMMAALSRVVRPAEHFFNTAADTFRNGFKSTEDFVAALRQRMGSAWDPRLHTYAAAFFQSASQHSHRNQPEQTTTDMDIQNVEMKSS